MTTLALPARPDAVYSYIADGKEGEVINILLLFKLMIPSMFENVKIDSAVPDWRADQMPYLSANLGI